MRWNPDAAGVAFDKDTGTSLFGDITHLYDGRYVAYRTDYQGRTPALFEVDPATGGVNLLVQSATAAAKVAAMAPLPNGNLLAHDNELGFVQINGTTLATTPFPMTASNGATAMSIGAMALSPGGQIYAWAHGYTLTGVYQGLFKVDPAARALQGIGLFEGRTSSIGFQGMAFTPDGRLFGVTEINAGSGGEPLLPNALYELNLQTGQAAFVMQRPELADVRGIVFVPEPGTPLVLLAAGAATLLRRRRHRRA
jgi:streptogramin lyase